MLIRQPINRPKFQCRRRQPLRQVLILIKVLPTLLTDVLIGVEEDDGIAIGLGDEIVDGLADELGAEGV